MRILALNDNKGQEQVWNDRNILNERGLFFFDRWNPDNVYDMGGYTVAESPELTVTEPAAKTRRVRSPYGHNYTEMEHREPVTVQMHNLVVSIPESRFDIIDLLQDVQARNYGKPNRFVFFVGTDPNCANDCDRFALLRGVGHLANKEETTGLVTYAGDEGGDEGGAKETVVIRVAGGKTKFNGLDVGKNRRSGLDDVYSLYIATLEECSGVSTFCPWQTAYYADSDGTAKPAVLKTSDRFRSADVAVDVTASTEADIITCMMKFRGDMFIGISDVHKGAATSGALLKSIGDAAAVDTEASTAGVHTMVVAGNRLHIFGHGGLWKFTSDGINWTTPANAPLSTTNIFASAYNPYTQTIYVVGAGGVGYAIRTTDLTVTALSGLGDADLLSVFVHGTDHIVIGATDGKLYEHYRHNELGGAFTNTKEFGTGEIHFIGGDQMQSRLVISHGADVWIKAIETLKDWVKIGSAPDASVILSGAQGYSAYERGVEFFLFGTTDGSIFDVNTCAPCVDTA